MPRSRGRRSNAGGAELRTRQEIDVKGGDSGGSS